jgi:hypothetical protein
MQIIIVELDTGEREFFDRLADGFIFAKEKEAERIHSVEYVAIGDTLADEIIVYRGQELRNMIRAYNLRGWIVDGADNVPIVES